MQQERTITTLRQPWEDRKLEARAMEEAAEVSGAERRSILPESSNTLAEAMLRYERLLIAAALTHAGGRLSKAARILGVSYQYLAYAIDHRHKELLELRSPIRRRGKRKLYGTKG